MDNVDMGQADEGEEADEAEEGEAADEAEEGEAADKGEEEDVTPKRHFLSVPFTERAKAKKRGAKWDVDAKSWYVPDDLLGPDDIAKFARWEINDDDDDDDDEVRRLPYATCFYPSLRRMHES